jgi:hypothetical protein
MESPPEELDLGVGNYFKLPVLHYNKMKRRGCQYLGRSGNIVKEWSCMRWRVEESLHGFPYAQ